MDDWNRRSVMAVGAVLATGRTLPSVEANDSDQQCYCLERSEGWSSYRGNAGNSSYVPAEGSFPKPETVAWEYDAGGSPAIVDGTVYLRTRAEVHALAADDGELLWTSDAVGADGTPAIAGETVVVGGDQLTALEAETGEVRWTREFDTDEPVTDPTVAFGTVYVVAEESLFAYDAADGSLRWRRETAEIETETGPGDKTETHVVSFASLPVAVANGYVYAAIGDHDDVTAGYAVIDVETGETQWTYWEWTLDDPHGSFVATESRVCTQTYVFDAQTGEKVDERNPSFVFHTSATSETMVESGDPGLNVYNNEMERKWSDSGGSNRNYFGWPVIVGETVIALYTGANGTELYGFDLEDGSEQWVLTPEEREAIGGDKSAATEETVYLAATEDTIYLPGGRLVALRPASDVSDENDEAGSGEDGDETGGDDSQNGDGNNETESDDKSGGTESDDGTNDEIDAGNDDRTPDSESNESTDATEDGGDDSTIDDGNSTDGTPGFTAGAGLAGGALSLEWLRRRATGHDSDDD